MRIDNILPRTLYHYCPLESFYGIITNKNIRLCSSKYTNDPNENTIIERILVLFKEKRGNKNEKIFLENAISKFNEHAFNKLYNAPFVFCLSEKGEDLNQWRNYADNGRGISIALNTGNIAFQRVFPTLLISSKVTLRNILPKIEEIYIDKCIYNYNYQYRLITNLIKFYAGFPEINDELINEFNLSLKFFSAFFKDQSFREEQEWRIICFPYTMQAIGPTLHKIKYIAKRSAIVPFFELPITATPENPLFEISYLGPNAKNDVNDLVDFVINSEVNFFHLIVRSRIEIQEIL